MINKELLKTLSDDIGVSLDSEALLRFDTYAEELVETNKVMNLTGITKPDEIVLKHFVDSLELLKYAQISVGASVIDVGTGAGFPGVPLLIARGDIQLTLLDSLQKRLSFLQKVLDVCKLSANCVHMRAEDGGKDLSLRETFDIATARAVAPLNILAEYTLPFVKVGGALYALKGTGEDIKLSEAAIRELGGELAAEYQYELPNGDKRMIVYVKKISQTPTRYPRKAKKITANPF
ncbi:MAG: 16S rRNA (guanine(527)-N(7))-methyltransferase RsmG [Ruminococcaceae bacterium]|nr:16S rRNA (guanine(527)-N(7))-methyltransferase RsmG [Oscillospiraceae bacterium]